VVTDLTAAVTLADMDIHNEFIAFKKDLVFYAGKPVLNKVHAFYDVERTPWDFTDAIDLYFTIWEEREGGLRMIQWVTNTNLTVSGNEIVLNASASDTSIERGKYYYEIAYTIAGGYEVLIAYGKAEFI
jgi:hypothetical protein